MIRWQLPDNTTARIELKHDRELEFGLFFIVTTALAGIYVVILSIWDIQSYSSLIIEKWRRRYNERRPHSSQNYITPEMAYFGVREKWKA